MCISGVVVPEFGTHDVLPADAASRNERVMRAHRAMTLASGTSCRISLTLQPRLKNSSTTPSTRFDAQSSHENQADTFTYTLIYDFDISHVCKSRSSSSIDCAEASAVANLVQAEESKTSNILNWVAPGDKSGEFKRQQSTFRDWISNESGAEFPAEKGRYHLYVSYACPWGETRLKHVGKASYSNTIQLIAR